MTETLENMMKAMAEQNLALQTELQEQSKASQAQLAASQAQIANLVASIQQMPGLGNPIHVAVNQAVPDNAVIRADKLQRVALGLRKSNRVKEFKHHKDSNVRLYIKKFDEEVRALKTMVGIDNVLSKEEYIPLFRQI